MTANGALSDFLQSYRLTETDPEYRQPVVNERLTIILAAMVVLGLSTLGAGRSASAAGPHIDDLALQLRGQSRELMTEFNLHYRHAPDFRHLMADSEELFRSAVHVHTIAHNSNNLHHLNADLAQLDGSFNHLEEVVGQIEHHARYCRTPGCGHFHGDTRHVRRLMASIADTIHHLRDDVLVRSRPPVPRHQVSAGYGSARLPLARKTDFRHADVRPTVARRIDGHGNQHGGVTVGRGGFRLHIGF